jgi:hypothetical protein
MAKTTPYPPCTGTVFWPRWRGVPGLCPDAASGNPTSPYCRAVGSKHKKNYILLRIVDMKTRVCIFMLCLGMIIVSCDTYNYIHYTVQNNTMDSIRLKYFFADNYFTTHAIDTSIILKGDQKDTIFIYTLISPFVYDPEEGDKMINITNVDILRLRDSAKMIKDVTLRKNWIYKETGRNSALMELNIKDTDF